MPIYSLSVADAVAGFANEYARWYQSGIDVQDPEGAFAVQRLTRELFMPHIQPEFTVSKNDDLFAIGSCFARGIERTMVHRGLSVLSAARDFDTFELSNDLVTRLGFTNKYSTASICNELFWALDPQAKFPTDSIVEVAEGVSVDPHTTPTLKFVDRDETFRRRRIISDVTRRISNCRVVFVTLGLVELWRDDVAGVYLNISPTQAMRNRYPGRYSFHVLSFADNRENLEHIGSLLARFGHPEVEIVVTVSPVPLAATFTGRDVVVANSYSKSVLRAAAEDWAAANSNVHYFPSYEIVMNSDRGLAWTADGRHVQSAVVKHIMDLFMKHYVESSVSATLLGGVRRVAAKLS